MPGSLRRVRTGEEYSNGQKSAPEPGARKSPELKRSVRPRAGIPSRPENPDAYALYLERQCGVLLDALEELKGSNVELEKRTAELEEKASLLEERNREIAQASASLEEKAKQLALVSKYKSEFLANMSHELRTPLNSLLILAKLLAENEDQTLTPKQVEDAMTSNPAGNDLLSLISQILDLSKIEAGKLQIETKKVSLGEVRDFVEGNFRQVAEQKGLDFSVRLAPDCPATITTDSQRL